MIGKHTTRLRRRFTSASDLVYGDDLLLCLRIVNVLVGEVIYLLRIITILTYWNQSLPLSLSRTYHDHFPEPSKSH